MERILGWRWWQMIAGIALAIGFTWLVLASGTLTLTQLLVIWLMELLVAVLILSSYFKH